MSELIEYWYQGFGRLQVIDYGRAGAEYRIQSRRTILHFIILESGARNEILDTNLLYPPGMTTRRIAHARIPYNSISGFPPGGK